MLLGYKFRIYPTKEQKNFFERHFGACRFIWNYFCGKYKNSQKFPSIKTLQEELKLLKKEPDYYWLNDINSQSLQVVVQRLNKAYFRALEDDIVKQRNKAIKKAKTPKQKKKAIEFGFPKFKSKKHSYQSFHIPQYVKIHNKLLYIPKLKSGIKVNFHRNIPDNAIIKNATISRKNNKYYVSFTVEIKQEKQNKIIKFPKIVGIDLGLEHFISLSKPIYFQRKYTQKIDFPKYYRKTERKFKKAYRKLFRKKEKSNNWYKQIYKIQKIHEKIYNQRNDFLHKLSTAITKQFDIVCVENLNVKGMAKNKYLSKSIHDAGWTKFIFLLEYKLKARGGKLIKAERYYASSKTCNVCSFVIDKLPLSKRKWICPNCKTEHDRDINASINLERVGKGQPELMPVEVALAESYLHDTISHLPMKQEAPAINL